MMNASVLFQRSHRGFSRKRSVQISQIYYISDPKKNLWNLCDLFVYGLQMRTITLIILHCSAVRPDQTSSAAQIDTWHRQRGFHLGIGYHYVIRRNGEIEQGRPEYMVGAHCQNHNAHYIGVSPAP